MREADAADAARHADLAGVEVAGEDEVVSAGAEAVGAIRKLQELAGSKRR